MKRPEVIELLKEISGACGDSVAITSVSIERNDDLAQPFSDCTESRFKLYLGTEANLNKDKNLRGILQKHRLQITKDKDFLIIYRLKEKHAR